MSHMHRYDDDDDGIDDDPAHLDTTNSMVMSNTIQLITTNIKIVPYMRLVNAKYLSNDLFANANQLPLINGNSLCSASPIISI